ncbi:MAG: hypothetical protein WEC59_02415 [Salibacteraceae bacterium]
MFDEIEQIIEAGKQYDNYLEAIDDNVIGKKSKSALGYAKTSLVRLYGFEKDEVAFKLFIKMWDDCNENEKRLLTFLLALKKDDLLQESIDFVSALEEGQVVDKNQLQKNIAKVADYTEKTLQSTTRNILSSWKQAGFLEGKKVVVKKRPDITYKVVSFAIALGTFDRLSGQFLLNAPYIKALCLSSKELDDLFNEAKVKDLIHYQNAGNVVSFMLNEKFVGYE